MNKLPHRSTKKKRLTATSFESLPDEEKNKFLREIEAKTPDQRFDESRPLNARERADWNAFKRKAGRPKLGKNGVEKVSISVEQSLLKQGDTYAKRHKLNRSELFTRGLQHLINAAM